MCVDVGEIKNFYTNHPFVFCIKIKGLIIFAGRVIDPTNGLGLANIPSAIDTKFTIK
jgi:hypothetical protein